MPKTITRTVVLYQFDELSDEAKEAARDWWRECENEDPSFTGSLESGGDTEECASRLGIEFADRPYKTMGGKDRTEPAIFWSGFSSQGDGASFDGFYRYKAGGAKAIRQHAPEDKTLHRIADDLQAVQKRHGYRLQATCKVSGAHYVHSGCMDVDVFDSRDRYRDLGDDEKIVRDAMREFADWIYAQLQAEYEYAMSDEAVDENIEANEYTFDANGKRADE